LQQNRAAPAAHFVSLRHSPQESSTLAPSADAYASSNGRTRPNIVVDTPGLSRFVPPGHKAIAIPWNRLYGAEFLQIGDCVDLTANFSLVYEAEGEEQERKPDGTVISRKVQRKAHEPTQRTYDETLGFRGEPWFAAIDAKVIGPVGFPPPSAATRFLGESLYQSDDERNHAATGPPVVFAIDERDQEAVGAALSTEGAIFSVAIHSRSGELATPAGWKRVVLAPEGLPAFEKLTMSRLEQGHTRRLMTRLVREADPAFAGALGESELRELSGRVLARYKERHSFLTADDFVPLGAQPGFATSIDGDNTIFVAANRDIDGLEHYVDGEYVAILFRGYAYLPNGAIAHGFDTVRPVSYVVAPCAKIVRSSQDGQTVLEVSTLDLARLQAALASASAEEGDESQGPVQRRRPQLVAVALPHQPSSEMLPPPSPATTAKATLPRASAPYIPDYDPLAGAQYTEVFRRKRREVHVFAGETLVQTHAPVATTEPDAAD
jgi:hypothetical protein